MLWTLNDHKKTSSLEVRKLIYSGKLLLCLSVFLLLTWQMPPSVHGLGEEIDPRKMAAVTEKINLLHQRLSGAGSEEVDILVDLLKTYRERSRIFPGEEDFEGRLAIDELSTRLQRIAPDEVHGLYYSAEVCYRQGEFEKCRLLALKAIPQVKVDFPAPQLHYLLARVEFLHVNFNESLSHAARALNGSDEALTVKIKTIMEKARKFQHRRNLIDEKIMAKPEDLRARLELAQLYLHPTLARRIANVEKTVLSLEEMMKNNPEFIEGYILLAKTYLNQLKDYKKGEFWCRKALTRCRTNQNKKEVTNLLNEILMKKINLEKR